MGNLLLTFQQLLRSGQTRQGAARDFLTRAAKGTFTRVSYHFTLDEDERHKGGYGINSMILLQDLLLLEEQEGSVNFKFGVIYAREGQTTDDEMLSNGKLPSEVSTREQKTSLVGWEIK